MNVTKEQSIDMFCNTWFGKKKYLKSTLKLSKRNNMRGIIHGLIITIAAIAAFFVLISFFNGG